MAKIANIGDAFMNEYVQGLVNKTCHRLKRTYDTKPIEFDELYGESFLIFNEIMSEFDDLDDTHMIDTRRYKYFSRFYEYRLMNYICKTYNIKRVTVDGVTKYRNVLNSEVYDPDRDKSMSSDFRVDIETKVMIEDALDNVNSSYKEIIELEFYGDHSPQYVCDVLNIDDRNRRQRKSRAVKAVKNNLDMAS